MFRVELG
jgi:hypothetical protein